MYISIVSVDMSYSPRTELKFIAYVKQKPTKSGPKKQKRPKKKRTSNLKYVSIQATLDKVHLTKQKNTYFFNKLNIIR